MASALEWLTFAILGVIFFGAGWLPVHLAGLIGWNPAIVAGSWMLLLLMVISYRVGLNRGAA